MTQDQTSRRHCSVLVLGDIGRSPRMQYHTLSLANELGYDVSLIGFYETDPRPELLAHPRIRIRRLPLLGWRKPSSRLVYIAYAVFKTLFQLVFLLWLLLFGTPRPAFLLVQTPPAVPSLFAAWLAASLRRHRFVVDWHNYAYSLMQLAEPSAASSSSCVELTSRSPLVRLSYWMEGYFGRRASAGLCVTRAMATDLHQRWAVDNVRVLYDGAPDFFQPTPLAVQRQLFERLHVDELLQPRFHADNNDGSTPRLRDDRQFLAVTSTSWTPDEDIGLLLDALETLDQRLRRAQSARRLLVFITGKGPLRDATLPRLAQLNARLAHVKIASVWLQAADYPLLLGSMDLGISLHSSSSGLDLPMKVVDMFGCQLPVLAIDFNCLAELVHDGTNGFVFTDRDQLVDQLALLSADFTAPSSLLGRLRANVSHPRWSTSWSTVCAPIFSQ